MKNATQDVEIPDFGSSKEMLKALVALPEKYWIKLNSNSEKYNLLRSELFSGGDNITEARKLRK